MRTCIEKALFALMICAAITPCASASSAYVEDTHGQTQYIETAVSAQNVSVISSESFTDIFPPVHMDLTLNHNNVVNLSDAASSTDMDNVRVVYRSSDKSVATVDKYGNVTAIGPGECIITTKIIGTKSHASHKPLAIRTSVTVQVAPESLSIEDQILDIDETSTLGIVILPNEVDVGTTFTWSSSDEAIASVDSTGTVRAIAPGIVTITATNDLGQKAECSVTVNHPPCSICGQPGHISAPYCTTKSLNAGALGRWSIPSVGVNVAVYESFDQSITNAKDSANYMPYGSQHLIADHKHQGFNAIKQCQIGDTAYLDMGSSVEEYVCTAVFKGHNTIEKLTDLDYNDLKDTNPSGITCYTCNENSRNVTIVFFEPVNP